jgi:chaperonin GroES
VVSENGRLPIKMLHDRVLVRLPREEGERRSSGGILIPSTAQVATRLMWAEALAVGNHVRTIELGDRVLFSPEDRHEVEIHGDVYVILRERDVHAIAARRIEPATGLYL